MRFLAERNLIAISNGQQMMKLERPKILLLDDDPDFLGLYRDLLSQLPSNPEIFTATTGARAIAMLETEAFALLVTDLNMPHMDGLQVLAIVRRKFPQLRTAVLTGVTDAQFRVRAYAMGLDLYFEKPITSRDTNLFLDCVESLLGREIQIGFRGMQSKSLVDIIQLECLCRSTTVLKVSNGLQDGKIWFQNGEIIDASAQNLAGEPAFQKILSWKTGNFEILPAEPERPRTILNSYQGLLLETAQALDEAQGKSEATASESALDASLKTGSSSRSFPRHKGVEFSLVLREGEAQPKESWAVENPSALAEWARKTLEQFQVIGDDLKAGVVKQIVSLGLQHHLVIATRDKHALCVGFNQSMTALQVREAMNNILIQWTP